MNSELVYNMHLWTSNNEFSRHTSTHFSVV